MALKIPTALQWDDRLDEDGKALVADINASLARLNEMRAVEINIVGPFARSKIAWKLATYQHALLHRIVALTDGAAVAWNHRSTLSAMLSGRALMETIALMSALERSVAASLTSEDLGALDALAQKGTFATGDPELLKDHPEIRYVNVLTHIDKFDRIAPGFRGHYDRLSERCHPNSLGHHFMFATINQKEGTTHYCDETEPGRNGHMIMSALAVLPLVESMMTRLSEAILTVADMHHRIGPVGGAS